MSIRHSDLSQYIEKVDAASMMLMPIATAVSQIHHVKGVMKPVEERHKAAVAGGFGLVTKFNGLDSIDPQICPMAMDRVLDGLTQMPILEWRVGMKKDCCLPKPKDGPATLAGVSGP